MEAEMARLDDPCVYRAYCHLVYLISLDLIEIAHCRQDGLARRPLPGIAACPRAAVTDGFEPGMASWPEPELLGDLPLEEVYLRTGRGQGGECISSDLGPASAQPILPVVGEYDIELRHPRAMACRAEKRRHPLPGGHRFEEDAPEIVRLQGGHGLQGDGPAIAQGGQLVAVLSHGPSSRKRTAPVSISLSGAGMYRPSIRTRAMSATSGAPVSRLSW
jgi:hypothetical protein